MNIPNSRTDVEDIFDESQYVDKIRSIVYDSDSLDKFREYAAMHRWNPESDKELRVKLVMACKFFSMTDKEISVFMSISKRHAERLVAEAKKKLEELLAI